MKSCRSGSLGAVSDEIELQKSVTVLPVGSTSLAGGWSQVRGNQQVGAGSQESESRGKSPASQALLSVQRWTDNVKFLKDSFFGGVMEVSCL